jgi:hypothetical protein
MNGQTQLIWETAVGYFNVFFSIDSLVLKKAANSTLLMEWGLFILVGNLNIIYV